MPSNTRTQRDKKLGNGSDSGELPDLMDVIRIWPGDWNRRQLETAARMVRARRGQATIERGAPGKVPLIVRFQRNVQVLFIVGVIVGGIMGLRYVLTNRVLSGGREGALAGIGAGRWGGVTPTPTLTPHPGSENVPDWYFGTLTAVVESGDYVPPPVIYVTATPEGPGPVLPEGGIHQPFAPGLLGTPTPMLSP